MIPLDHGRLDILTKLAKFIVVGVSGVIVNSAILYLLWDLIGFHLVAASVLAVEVAIVNNYLWNNWWTFGRRYYSAVGFAKFNLVSLGGLVITTSTLYILVTLADVNVYLANLLGIVMATTWNFGINLVWTWRGSG